MSGEISDEDEEALDSPVMKLPDVSDISFGK